MIILQHIYIYIYIYIYVAGLSCEICLSAYREFIEVNKYTKKLQIYMYIQELMAAHDIDDNGYLNIE